MGLRGDSLQERTGGDPSPPQGGRNRNAVRREDGQLQKAPELGMGPTAWRVGGDGAGAVVRPGGAFMPGTGLDAVKTQICHMCVGGSQRGQGRDRPPQNIPTDAEGVPLSQPLFICALPLFPSSLPPQSDCYPQAHPD